MHVRELEGYTCHCFIKELKLLVVVNMNLTMALTMEHYKDKMQADVSKLNDPHPAFFVVIPKATILQL